MNTADNASTTGANAADANPGTCPGTCPDTCSDTGPGATREPADAEHVDVLIVGAGLSGVGAACHLRERCPDKKFLVLEGRDSIGGTWDLFRYPGIRSDSDMFTLGYSFRPWTHPKSIADGPSILEYVRDTARQHGVDSAIHFGHQVQHASWSSAQSRWTVRVSHAGQTKHFTCSFLLMCSGYYRYDEGYTPDFPGIGQFAGRLVHPQHWPADLDYTGKQVVVIGSGATAVTLVPELTKQAARVTMLQRSPTYVVSRPDEDPIANRLRRLLPMKLAYTLTRWKNVLLGMYVYQLSQRKPAVVKNMIVKGVQAALGPDYDVERHFTPSYNPWNQRLCLVPNADLFKAIRDDKAAVVTDQIKRFTANGIELQSGATLPADIVVTATGLNLQVLGGMSMDVDGRAIDLAHTMSYKGMMYSDVPNLVSVIGYTNASWTLKADLTCEYVCRILKLMDRRAYKQCTPRRNDASVQERPWVDFSSGYIQRSLHLFPKQGDRAPWRLHQNYARDMMSLRLGKVDDGVLQFAR